MEQCRQLESLETQMGLDWQHRPGMGKHMSLKAPPTTKKTPKAPKSSATSSWLPCLGGLAIAGGSAYAVAQGGLTRQILGSVGVTAGAYLCWSSR